jgi:DNA repair exonuclease SbcCD ATPase subunit
MSTRMERDKYYSEYSILKKEYEKLHTVYREENDKCVRRFEENEKHSIKQITVLQEKYNDVSRRFEMVEIEKNNLELEVKELRAQDSSRDRLLHKFNRNEEETEKMIQKLRVNSTTLLKEKENLERELERNKSMNETKLKQVAEKYEMKVLVLENSIKYQQDQYNSSEDKAFDVLKKQEAITNKIREEYVKTVTYYENVVENLIKENKALKKQFDIEDDENEPKKFSAY